jgi:hypothetical protein
MKSHHNPSHKEEIENGIIILKIALHVDLTKHK